jgi:hypothetical protein
MKTNYWKTNNALFVTVIVIFSFLPSKAQNDKRDAAAIAYAKRFSVSRLDSKLPPKRFGDWFQQIVGRATKINWEVNDCGEQSGNPAADKGRDFPMCVEAIAEKSNGIKINVSLVVGTFKRGIIPGKPQIGYAGVGKDDKWYEVAYLRDLPSKLKEIGSK